MITPPVWVSELAERFWAAAGPPPPLPRDLSAAVTNAALVSVIDRRELRLSAVTAFLERKGYPAAFDEPDRPLRAALYCWKGHGFLFLDATDPPDERRFSLAHELAHFLRDYDAVRRQVERALGSAALDVLDGTRPPTAEERVYAVLRTRPLAPHAHLMRRDDSGRPKTAAERDAEQRADRLAFELLAPAELFQADPDPAAVEARLIAEFGLPPSVAWEYASLLLPTAPSAGSLVERLKKLC